MAPRAPRSSAGCSSRRPRPCTTSKTPSRPATASAARVTSEGDDASIGLELPVLEWRPETWYSGSFGSSFSTELGLSLDTGRATASGGLFLRVGFDAKRYVASPL